MLQVNDSSSMPLLGETQEDDRKQLADLIVSRMEDHGRRPSTQTLQQSTMLRSQSNPTHQRSIIALIRVARCSTCSPLWSNFLCRAGRARHLENARLLQHYCICANPNCSAAVFIGQTKGKSINSVKKTVLNKVLDEECFLLSTYKQAGSRDFLVYDYYRIVGGSMRTCRPCLIGDVCL